MKPPQPPHSTSGISVNTEIPVIEDSKRGGWLFYDANCPLCARWMHRTRSLLARHQFSFVPLQTPGTAARLHLAEQELMTEMRLLLPSGAVFGGADAYVEIARQIGWARPLAWAARWPGVL